MPRAVLVLSLLLTLTGAARADFDALLTAARTGDTEATLDRLAAGDSPNPPEFHSGYSPLQFAARNGDVDSVRALLAAGADTEYRDHNGDRALLWAARSKSADTVRLLLEAGSPADSPDDPYGHTPLMLASFSRDADMVRVLLQHGADPHRFDQSSDTALHYAAWGGATEVAGVLLEAGANPGAISDILYRTPLHLAASYGDPELIRMLMVDGPRNSRDLDGTTALLTATLSGHDENVAALLAGGARPDVASDAGMTALLVAVRDGHVEIARLLLEAGADIVAVDSAGQGVAYYLDWHPVPTVLPEGSRAASIGDDPSPEELARLDAAHAEIRAMIAAR
jgi:ankyrin repeat protein